MKQQLSAGGVVFTTLGDSVRLLMIEDRWGRWSFPKGHVEQGETPVQAALREVEEETGVTGDVLAELGDVQYYFRDGPDLVKKRAIYFLIKAESENIVPQTEEIRHAAWVPLEEVWKKSGYENNTIIIERAQAAISKKHFLRSEGCGDGH